MSADSPADEVNRRDEDSDTEPLDLEAPIVQAEDSTVENQSIEEGASTDELDSWDEGKPSDSRDAILTLSPESQRTNCANSQEIPSSEEEVEKKKEIHIVEKEIEIEDTADSQEDDDVSLPGAPYPDHVYASLWENYSDFVVLPYLHSSTVLVTPEGDKSIAELKDGDVLLDYEGCEVPLKQIFKVQPKMEFIRFGNGSLQCKEPDKEPSYDLYVAPTVWFLYKHEKAMDCENIMNGNSISRTSIEVPADVFLLSTENGDYVRCGGIDIATIPQDALISWLLSPTGGADLHIAQRDPSGDNPWIPFSR